MGAPATADGARDADILLVEDDDLVVRTLMRALDGVCVARARTSEDALAIVDECSKLRLAVVDISLSDRARGGLDVLDALIDRRPNVMRVVLSATGDSAVINRVAVGGTQFMAKPFGAEVPRFLRRQLDGSDQRGPMAKLLATRAREWGLSPMQARVFERLALGKTRQAIIDELEIEQSTLKTHIAKLLAASGYARVETLVASLLSELSELRR